VRYCGAEPIFVDIEDDSYNMDPDELQRILTEDCINKGGELYYKDVKRIAVGESPLIHLHQNRSSALGRVAAILPVHQMGTPCNIARIVEIAEEYALPVVEDAACSIGSEVSFDAGATWESIGKPHGDIACFSFHPRKILTTGDGGMITTNKGELDARCRLLRQHGMSLSDTVRHGSQNVIFENYSTTGFNYRMTDIQAAVGIEQLKRLDDILVDRRGLAAQYAGILKKMPHLKLPKIADGVLPNYQSYPVRFLDFSSIGQKKTMQHLLDRGIATRRGIMNAHQEPAYRDANWSLPKSELCRDQTILLPLFSGMSTKDLEYITTVLKETVT
jgi:dTDP-4-amino-4,6-dideoxygalactose transaminase